MIRADDIPDEVVEAGASAEYAITRAEAIDDYGAIADVTYCPWEELSPDAKEYYKKHARAAIAAALNAWPGEDGPIMPDADGYLPGIFLPFPQKKVTHDPR